MGKKLGRQESGRGEIRQTGERKEKGKNESKYIHRQTNTLTD